MTQPVRFEVGEDHVGVLTLSRPEKLNALDEGMFRGLHEAAERAAEAAAERRCRAVLITGEGRAFCAGLDVALFAAQLTDGAPDDQWIAWLQRAFTRYEDLPVPTIAAVTGVAIGGGSQLAISCHLRVAAPDARFGLLESRWALVPDLGATMRLPRLVGLSRATDLAMSGRLVDAGTALAWGLVDAVLEPQEFRPYAARLAAGPTVALGAVARLMRENPTRPREEALAADRAAQFGCLASKDFQEAVSAAAKRRDPVFTGE